MRRLAICAAGVLAAASIGIPISPIANLGDDSQAMAAVTSDGAAPERAEDQVAEDMADDDDVTPLAANADPTSELTGDIVFSVPSGTFKGSLSVSLSTSVTGAQIRYTTDGSAPNASSTLYQGTPVQFTKTTQIRAQAFASGTATGAAGTGLYVARAIDATHDLPVLVLDDYGKGKPGREYVDVTVMELLPSAGSVSLASAPALTTRAGFHLRGQSSAMFEKAPYRLELRDNADKDADYPMLGMPADSDWVLRGPFTDKSLIRDALVHDLGKAMGIHAPRYAFCEVYLNLDSQPMAANDYQGVYLLVETIKNSKNRLDLKKLKADDVTSPNVEGGYIFKFEWMAAEEPTLPCSGNDATCWHYLELVDPSEPRPAQKTWITQHLQRFHDMLHGPNVNDPTTGYASWIDVRSFIDQIIINELGRSMDAYLRSQYFYKDRAGKITAGPLWDFDLTFGVGGYFNNNLTSGWQYEQTRTPVAQDWFSILLRDPSFVNQLKARWRELREGILSNTELNARIASLSAPLTNAAQRNFQRWPNLNASMVGVAITPTSPTWQGQLQVMRDWISQRTAWLDSTSAWGGTVPPATTPPVTTPPATTTPPVGSKGCAAAYTVTNQWDTGFQADVKVTAGTSAISSWRVTWTFGNAQTITSSWNTTVTASGSAVTAANLPYNGALGAGASTSFGFTGTRSGANTVPAVTCTAS